MIIQQKLTLPGPDIADHKTFTPKEVISRIKKIEWKTFPYSKQNWGNWLHHMGAYVGKMKPAMAHHLILSSTKKNQKILDPFCGIGTVNTESSFLKRYSFGNDLNPYAYSIASAKSDRRNIKEHIEYINSIKINTSRIKIDKFSDFLKKFYDDKTLKEIIFLLNNFKKNNQDFLLGCLLGIIHGHRPGHLSAVTSLVIPYLPREKPIYKEVKPRLIKKVERMYRDGFQNTHIPIISNLNSKELGIKKNAVDAIISSPPYFNTLDYSGDNKLRNEFLGIDETKKIKLKKELTQQNATYIDEMEEIGIELKRVLKPGGYCIFVLGDLHLSKKITNTAKEISESYSKLGFVTHAIIDDKMPINKAVPDKRKRNKLDRILIMTNGKHKKI
tara:strand:- start:2972 stop:4129 length:1158 start_codon:yes stop_codon:yes gene_type:complete